MNAEQRKSCADCRYTAGQDGGSLTCQRYPQPHRVARSYLCGEYQPQIVDAQQEPKRRGRPPRLAITAQPVVTKDTEE